ncbi:MAG TPA: hypothetical protein VFQ35_03640, partial [Polyangiaceae bacterium]|nr:hypothetical protein [Polyangiaceae bacterium]
MTMETDFSLDSRRQIIDHTASFDDAVVFLGLVAAGRIKSEECAEAFHKGKRIERFIGQVVSQRLIRTEEWTALQQLWYRLRVPFGVASLGYWQLFCVAYGQTGQIAAACDRAAAWIEAIAGAPPESRVRVYSMQTGMSAERGVVAMQHDMTSLDCLARSAFDELPLVPLQSADELALLTRDGTRVVLTDVARDLESAASNRLPQPSRSVASVREFCGERPFSVARGSREMREFWCELTPEDRTYILVHLEQNIQALEIVRFSYGNQVMDNESQAAVLNKCRATRPEEWSQRELVLASLLWGWTQAGFMVHEFNQSELSLHGFRIFLERRIH